MQRGATWDYIVVGAGTAGCLLANRLSADPQVRVLLLEAGGRDNYAWIHIPVGYLYCIGNPRTDWMFQTEPDAGLNGRVLRYPRGKVLGGSSSINGMIYMRGQARDYDGWADTLGDPAWRWAACLPYFMRHEAHWRGADAHHGAGGEWRVERQRLSWELLDAFALAAQQAGIPARADFNSGDNEGVGYFEVNQRRGLRWNASQAFLRPLRQRPNLEVRTGSQVQRVVVERRGDGALSASGVDCRSIDGGTQRLNAARAVVLAAGAIGSPQLLQLSGIGPAPLLRRTRHCSRPRLARRRRESAGPPADSRRVRRDRCDDAEHDGPLLARQGAHRPAIPFHAKRPDEHGAIATWGLHALGARAALARPRVPRAAAVAGCLRPAAAPLCRFHGQRVQPQSGQAAAACASVRRARTMRR